MGPHDSSRVLPAGTGRVLAWSQVTVGLVTIVRARQLGSEQWLGLSPRSFARIVRVLGSRQVVQGIVMVLRGDDVGTLVVGGAVDALHAASLLPLIAVHGPYRRRATLSAVLASLAAGVAIGASER